MKINHKLLAITALICSQSFAIQEFQVGNNAEIDAIISDHDVNRISIAGARITQVKFTSKELKVDKDEQNGQIFVYPIGVNRSKVNTITVGNLKAQTVVGSMVSMFLMDDQGRSFNLRLRMQGVPSETILVKPLTSGNLNGSSDFTTQVATIIETMYLNNKSEEAYVVTEHNTSIKLWKEVDFELYKSYTDDQFSGSVFYLRNKTNNSITLAENQFWKPNTVAVAIEQPVLKPGEITRIFIVGAKQDE